jgi:hypothetical protein
MRKPVKEIENVLQNHDYSINSGCYKKQKQAKTNHVRTNVPLVLRFLLISKAHEKTSRH